VRAEGAVGSAPGRGGTDGTRSGWGDVEVTGLVELLGQFAQALSLKPDLAAEFDLGGNGDCTCEMVASIAGKWALKTYPSSRNGHMWQRHNRHRRKEHGRVAGALAAVSGSLTWEYCMGMLHKS
jgi:hypothetical protein